MSYDFRLFLPQPGTDPIETAQSLLEEESDEINPGSPVPSKEKRKRTIADAVLKADPALEVFPFEFKEIAMFEKITVQEAKLRYRHLELNGPEDGPGIQITLIDDGATLTVPYWHKHKKAKAVFAKIWEYLKIIQQVGGYQVYDPQLECIVNLDSDLEKATKCYSDVVKQITG